MVRSGSSLKFTFAEQDWYTTLTLTNRDRQRTPQTSVNVPSAFVTRTASPTNAGHSVAGVDRLSWTPEDWGVHPWKETTWARASRRIPRSFGPKP